MNIHELMWAEHYTSTLQLITHYKIVQLACILT